MPSDMGKLFNEDYYAHNCGLPYERNEHWLSFFAGIARRVSQDIAPRTVLDAGCAKGFLVEGLRGVDIEAFGIDISEYAIGSVHRSIQEYCQVGSLTTELTSHYDLIICIEVLEHMQKKDSEKAVEVLCKASNDILFSSSPFDYKESTHFNVQPPEYWAELFAKHGFFRDVDFDASFITPWAIRFRSENKPIHRIVREFERKFWLLWQENQAVREELCRLEAERSENARTILQSEKLLEKDGTLSQKMNALEERSDVLEQKISLFEEVLATGGNKRLRLNKESNSIKNKISWELRNLLKKSRRDL